VEKSALKVRVYFLKRKPENMIEIDQVENIAKWILENIYDLVWEAEFKNLVTPSISAMKFRVEPNPFGIPAVRKTDHPNLSVGDIIQIGSTYYLVLQNGFREMIVHKS